MHFTVARFVAEAGRNAKLLYARYHGVWQLNLYDLQRCFHLFKELLFNLRVAVPKLKGDHAEGEVAFCTNEAFVHSRGFNASGGLVLGLGKRLKNN